MTRTTWTLLLAPIALGALLSVAFAKGGPPKPPPPPPPPPAPTPAPPPPPAAPPASPGVTFAFPEGGLTLDGPPGWALSKTTEHVSSWALLATFSDANSGAQATLYVRRASAVTIQKLRNEVTKEFADDPSYTVNSITDLPSGMRRPWPGLLVDATQSRPTDPPAAGQPAPPPTAFRLYAGYYLAGENEFMLAVTARAATWARVQATADRLVQNLTLKPQALPNAGRGEGGYQNDHAKFSCRFPDGYGVHVPDRENALVEFVPATDAPTLGIFRYTSEADLDGEAKALTDYYTGDEVNGEASSSPMEIAGRNGILVTAKGRIGARDQFFLVAVVKRDKDTFRLRVAAEVTQEQAARTLFNTFVRSFRLIGP